MVGSNKHTRWKHKWEWHNCGCVWDKLASEWTRVEDRTEKKEKLHKQTGEERLCDLPLWQTWDTRQTQTKHWRTRESWHGKKKRTTGCWTTWQNNLNKKRRYHRADVWGQQGRRKVDHRLLCDGEEVFTSYWRNPENIAFVLEENGWRIFCANWRLCKVHSQRAHSRNWEYREFGTRRDFENHNGNSEQYGAVESGKRILGRQQERKREQWRRCSD